MLTKRRLTHPLVLLAVLLALFFYKEVFLGRVFSPADLLFQANPWHAVRPPGFERATNYLRGDEVYINYPHRIVSAGDVKRFGFSLWQEHTLGGSPTTFPLHYLGGWAYPPMLAFLGLPAGVANSLYHLPIPLLAGIFMYLLLTRLVQNPWARLFGAVAYALNGFLIVWLSAQNLPLVVMMLPLLFYLADRFLSGGERRTGVLFALALGISFLFVYPPANIITCIFIAIFGLVWTLQDVRGRLPRTALFFGLTLLGIGVGMVATLPTVSVLANFAAKTYRGPMLNIPPKFLSTFVFPNIAGNPLAYDWRSRFGNYSEFIAYDGLLPLMLGATGVVIAMRRKGQRDPLVLTAIVVVPLSLLMAFAEPVVRVSGSIPPFNNLNPARWNLGVVFALPLLAAYGFDRLLADRGRWRARLWIIFPGVLVVLLAAATLLFVKRHEFLHDDNFITRDYRVRLVLLVAGAAALVWLARSRAARFAPVAIVALLCADLFTFGVDFNPALELQHFYPETPALRLMEQSAAGYRVLPVGGIYLGDVMNAYGLDVATGFDQFRDEGYTALIGPNMSEGERKFWHATGYLTLGASLRLDDPVWDLLGIKFAYFPWAQSSVGSEHWRRAYQGEDGTVFENLHVLPRQFVVSGSGRVSAVAHTEKRPDSDRLQVVGPGLLVWSKPQHPDWVVRINGREVKTQRYRDYFLAAALHSGANDVEVEFRPLSYYLGAAIAAACLVALLLIGLLPPKAPDDHVHQDA